MKRFPLATLLTGGVVVAILLLYMCTFVVRFNEAAIKLRFGRVDQAGVIREPGLKFKLPPPIERVQTYDLRERTLDTTESELKTADGKNIILSTAVVWKIADPLLFFTRVPDGDVKQAESQIRNRLNQTQTAVIGRMPMADFVNLDAAVVDAGYEKFRAEMLKEAAKGVRDDYGVQITFIDIRRISLPEAVTQTVMTSMSKERNAIAAKYREEGKATANTITGRAETSAATIMAFANRKAEEIASSGIAASTPIMERINRENPEFFEFLRWMDALRAMFKQRTTFFIDAKSPIYDRFVSPPGGLSAPAAEPEGRDDPKPATENRRGGGRGTE